MLPAPGRLTFPVRLEGPATVTAEVTLMEREWRDGTGAVQATICSIGPDGAVHCGAATTLETAQRGGRGRARRLTAAIPVGRVAFALVATKIGDGPQAAAHVVWSEATLDAGATADPPPRLGPDRAPAPDLPPPADDSPVFSVLCPVHDPPVAMLVEAVASVRAQSHPAWQLCLVDDASADPEVIRCLDQLAATDPRIHLQRLPDARGIAGATNAALAAATGDFIALLDHDDALTPDALQLVAGEIAARPELDMIYSDEAIVRDGAVSEHYLKPGWAPESLCSLMFTSHLGVYRRSLADEIGGFRGEFDGAQDHDFALRISERTSRIAHLPRSVYRWRAHAASTAEGGQVKPYAAVAGRAAVAGHLTRRGIAAEVRYAGPGLYAIAHDVPVVTQISIVCAAREPTGLREAVATWVTEPHTAWDLVIAVPEGAEETFRRQIADAGLEPRRAVLIAHRWSDHAAGLARAAAAARGDHLMLLLAPAAGLTHDWMRRLIGYSQQDGVAAAAPTVVAANGQIQDAGIAMPTGFALPLTHGLDATKIAPPTLNVLAVNGAMMTSRAAYERVGGLDPSFRTLALPEFCVRAADDGLRAVLVSEARLQAVAPDVATNDVAALSGLRERWAASMSGDPYYNPNYRDDRGDFVPRPGLS